MQTVQFESPDVSLKTSQSNKGILSLSKRGVELNRECPAPQRPFHRNREAIHGGPIAVLVIHRGNVKKGRFFGVSGELKRGSHEREVERRRAFHRPPFGVGLVW